MKKKMLFMAALAGAVTLGSCVKDDVSSSVEAVRNAKAEELRGLAAEHNANATLAIASAAVENARVALVNAQAALEKANAEAAQANADFEKAQLAARIDAAVSAFEAQTQVNKNALVDALNAASLQESDHISNLIARFSAAYSKFTTAQQALVNAKSKLAKAKIGQADEEAMNAAYIQTQLNTIAQEKAKIAFLETLTSENMTVNDQAVAAANYAAQLADAKAEFDQSEEVKAFVAASKDFADALAAYTEYHNLDGTADGLIDPFVAVNYFMALTDDVNPSAVLAYELYNSYAMAAQDIEANIGGDLASGQTFSGTIKHYAVSEVGKNAWANYLDEHAPVLGGDEYMGTVSAKDAWDDAKTTLADDQGKLGKDGDTKDSKFKDSNDVEDVTLYGKLKIANDALADAIKAEATARDNKTKLPAAVKSAFKDMWNVYDKGSSTAKDKATALYKFAQAVENAYGKTKYNHLPANIDFALAADEDEIVNYLLGSAGHTFVGTWDAKTQIESLVITGSPLLTGTLLAAFPATFDDDALDDLFENVTGAVAATRDDEAESCVVAYNKAAAALGNINDAAGKKQVAPGNTAKETAYAAVKTANGNISTKKADILTDMDNVVTAEADYNASVAQRKAKEDALAAVDLKEYEAVCADLKDALAAYNEAAVAMKTAENQINDIQKEANAIANLDPATDVPTQIATANAAIALAEDNLAKIGFDAAAPGSSVAVGDDAPTAYIWDPTFPTVNTVTGETTYGAYVVDTTISLTYDELVDFYEAEVEAAQTQLEAATAELALATKALEAYEIDLDGDDEPADEPAPTDEPADEPAEGEGESEGEGE